MLDRFERDFLDGNDMTVLQLLLFVPLMLAMLAREAWRWARELLNGPGRT